MSVTASSEAVQGLSTPVARERLAAEGPNELPRASRDSAFGQLAKLLVEPMVLILLASAGLYLLLGEPAEAGLLSVMIAVVLALTVYQERKAQHALDALRELSSPRALVLRDGRPSRVAAREVVRGDWLVLSEGDRIAADAIVRSASVLRVDESLLTGESVPVDKAASAAGSLARAAGDEAVRVHAGTLVVGGSALAEVTATGTASSIGRIGTSLGELQAGSSPLRREVRRLVRRMALFAALVCTAITLVYATLHDDWLAALLSGLAAAMSLMPEELPVVLAVFLALGAWRLAARNVLVRQLPQLEALGAISTLCVDKTGTLTQNRMALRWLVTPDGARQAVGDDAAGPPTAAFQRLADVAALACPPHPVDPMERALIDAARVSDRAARLREGALLREYPLSNQILATTKVWGGDQAAPIAAAKGAPETIAALCRLDPGELARIEAHVDSLAHDGVRVLGVAAAAVPVEGLPTRQDEFRFEFLGLVGLRDPVRPGAVDAVRDCAGAGVRVIMITGDHPQTAMAIGREIGLPDAQHALLGVDIEQLDESALRTALARTGVVARARPEHKLRIVRALQAAGAVVGMTGDGVNDAPALKAADVGIAMGQRGTDVAREAAALVITDDDFSSIVGAIRLGRRLDHNLRNAFSYIIAIHVPIAAIALLPILAGLPALLLPQHIAFLELIIDPSCTLAFEAEPENPVAMSQPPRDPGAPVVAGATALWAVASGVLAAAAALGVMAFGHWLGEDGASVRAAVFAVLVAGNLALLLALRSQARSLLQTAAVANRTLWLIAAAALAALAAVIGLESLRGFFRFALPSAALSGACLLAVAALVVALELTRRAAARRTPHPLAHGLEPAPRASGSGTPQEPT